MIKFLAIILTILIASGVKTSVDPPILEPRTGEGLAYDSLNHRVVMFGGYLVTNPFKYLNGTWTYNFKENLWTHLSSKLDPGPRGAAAMAYSPDHQMILLFGGMSTIGRLGDTWEFNCKTDKWVKVEPNINPEGRSDSALIYDTVDKVFILYGGWGSGSGLTSDTWLYDPVKQNWSEMKTDTNPGRMYGHSMVWDQDHKRAILYSGHLNSPLSRQFVENPWFYYPETKIWIESPQDFKPTGRYWGAMGYDPEKSILVYFGGTWGEGPCNETIINNFTENKWVKIDADVKPSSRVISKIVYVTDSRFFLFGGATPGLKHFNDTWIFSSDNNKWVEFHPKTIQEKLESPKQDNGIPGYPLPAIFLGLFCTILYARTRLEK